MTDREIFNLEEDTLVRIKDSVDCGEVFKKPCRLRFRNDRKLPKNEYQYGIYFLNDKGETLGCCYEFHSSDYELVK